MGVHKSENGNKYANRYLHEKKTSPNLKRISNNLNREFCVGSQNTEENLDKLFDQNNLIIEKYKNEFYYIFTEDKQTSKRRKLSTTTEIEMPLLSLRTSAEYMSLENSLKSIKLQLNKNLPVDDSFREELLEVPITHVDDLMNNLIDLSAKDVEHSFIAERALQIYLSRRTLVIRLNNFPHTLIHSVLKILLDRCHDVEVLDLRGFKMLNNNEHFNNESKLLFAQLLKKLKLLKILHLNEMIVPLNLIFEWCPLLKELTTIESAIYDMATLNDLQGLNELEKLNLGHIEYNPDLEEVIQTILLTCPNVKWIDYSYMGHAIDTLDNMLFALREVADRSTTSKVLDSIVESCPDLRSISLEEPQLGILPRLVNVHQLEEIKLVSFKNEELLNALPKLGSKLTRLELVDTGCLDVSTILKSARKMKCLKLINVKNIILSEKELVICPFLKQFVIGGRCHIESPNFYEIFYSMPSIENLDVNGWNEITGKTVEKLVDSGVWKNLKTFEIGESKLTFNSLVKLLLSCDQLKELRGLKWQINQEEIEKIKQKIRELNMKFK